jgi:hypothetical protein
MWGFGNEVPALGKRILPAYSTESVLPNGLLKVKFALEQAIQVETRKKRYNSPLTKLKFSNDF